MDLPINASKIDWPQDRVGMTSRLKREGCRAIGRMGGDTAAFDVVMGVIRILAQHAKDKLQEQQDIKSGNLAKVAEARVEKQRVRDEAEGRMEQSLINQGETLKNRLAALQKRKEDALNRVIPVPNPFEQERIAQGIGTGKT